jgi:hypothetical protein
LYSSLLNNITSNILEEFTPVQFRIFFLKKAAFFLIDS